MTAFMWMIGIMITVLLQFGTVLIFLLTLIYDRINKTKTFRISLTVLVAFWICNFAQKIIKHRITQSIELKAEILIYNIEDYNNQNGYYPNTLSIPEFEAFNLKTALGSTLIYSSYPDSSFSLRYDSFDGSFRKYNTEGWYWDD